MPWLKLADAPLRSLPGSRLLSALALVSIVVLGVPVAAKTPERFSAIAFHVWTGDDDLRSHSEAWVDLTFPDGTQKRCWLKKFNEQGWDNNTEHDGRQCIIVPRTFHALRATKLKLSYAGQGAEFQTWDNWNVNRVRIVPPVQSRFAGPKRCGTSDRAKAFRRQVRLAGEASPPS
jgi:hypothetical protein